MEIQYSLGMLRAELYFPGAGSLKESRMHIRSIRARLGNMGFSVAVTGPSDLPRQTWILAVIPSGSPGVTRRKLESAAEIFHDPRWELMMMDTNILTPGQVLQEWETI